MKGVIIECNPNRVWELIPFDFNHNSAYKQPFVMTKTDSPYPLANSTFGFGLPVERRDRMVYPMSYIAFTVEDESCNKLIQYVDLEDKDRDDDIIYINIYDNRGEVVSMSCNFKTFKSFIRFYLRGAI